MADKKKILIVEDDSDFMFILKQGFEKQGFEMSYASNGEEAIAIAEQNQPDLILLDILMPKMDGITMAKKLREKEINSKIIFLTNLSDLEYVSRAIENAGEADYMVKSEMRLEKIIESVKEKINS